MKRKLKILLFILLILIGILMFVYAEIDDSPGGQLIGMIVVFASAIGIIKNVKK